MKEYLLSLFRNRPLVHILVIVFAIGFSVSNFFIQDDAYISFRYAQNFAEGHGLVFNVGDRVEGYSNFLWTFILGTVNKVGVDSETFVFLFSILLIPIIYFLFRTLASNWRLSEKAIVGASTALLFNFSFSSYLSGGLETPLQTLLFLLTLVLASFSDKRRWMLAVQSVIFGLLILNRMDSGLLVLATALYYTYFVVTYNSSNFDKLIRMGLLSVPGLVIISIWIVWKYNYYGDVVPNTYYAKIGANSSSVLIWAKGLAFVIFFAAAYFLLPSLLLLVKWRQVTFILRKIKFQIDFIVLAVLIVLLYNAYFIYVGGDFMEFRFQVPLMPIYLLLMFSVVSRLELVRLFTILLVVSSILYSVLFKGAISGFESISYLKNHISMERQDWRGIGEELREMFGNEAVTIAVSPAGAIPYFSGLRTIDMLGLNDVWVAKNGLKYKNTPGHYKIAPLSYLQEEKVNLIIGHPIMVANTELESMRGELGFATFEGLLPKISVSDLAGKPQTLIEVPINKHFTLLCWYLTPSIIIDKVIVEHQLKTHSIRI